MVRLPTLVDPCRPCDNTASAALMKGWISSIFIELGSCSRASRVGDCAVFAEHILDDFVEHFRLYGFLHEMPCTPLQRGDNVLLVSDGGDHHDACFRMLLHYAFSRFDPFHLRHGNVHEHDVRMSAVELADGSQAVAGFSRHLPAKTLDHAGEIFPGKNGVIYDQVADRLPVLAALYWCKLLHTDLPFLLQYHAHSGRNQITLVTGFSCLISQLPARTARPGFISPVLRPQMACSVAPITSRPTTRMAYAHTIAVLGIP